MRTIRLLLLFASNLRQTPKNHVVLYGLEIKKTPGYCEIGDIYERIKTLTGSVFTRVAREPSFFVVSSRPEACLFLDEWYPSKWYACGQNNRLNTDFKHSDKYSHTFLRRKIWGACVALAWSCLMVSLVPTFKLWCLCDAFVLIFTPSLKNIMLHLPLSRF